MKKAWIISVNMGYGHQRTAFPLKHLAFEEKIINANDYEGIPKIDRKIWENTRKFYEFISRFSRIPLIGKTTFLFYDQFQKIFSFYPKRDLSKPNFTLKKIYSTLKRDWGRDLIEKLKIKNEKLKTNLPIISTFFIPAFMAEFFNYPGEIFCLVCDADISRTWAPLHPKESRIKYFAPNSWVVSRLKLYGVKKENIFLTGYPLPLENLGTEKLEIAKHDLKYRLLNLDPKKIYFRQYVVLIKKYLENLPPKSNHPLTIMFTVGGAGAQKEIAIQIIKSLAVKIWAGEIKIILVAGIKEKVREYFLKNIEKLGLKDKLGKEIEVVFAKSIQEYFLRFNQSLKTTDILWTKPSELSFYIGLGLPIIIAPSIGSQEDFNRKWLLRLGSGIVQENPKYARQWLFDFLNSGRFAKAAMQGFIEGEKLGTINISRIITNLGANIRE